jgi:hypothetical protein
MLLVIRLSGQIYNMYSVFLYKCYLMIISAGNGLIFMNLRTLTESVKTVKALVMMEGCYTVIRL